MIEDKQATKGTSVNNDGSMISSYLPSTNQTQEEIKQAAVSEAAKSDLITEAHAAAKKYILERGANLERLELMLALRDMYLDGAERKFKV